LGWYILYSFGTFFPVLVSCANIHLATLISKPKILRSCLEICTKRNNLQGNTEHYKCTNFFSRLVYKQTGGKKVESMKPQFIPRISKMFLFTAFQFLKSYNFKNGISSNSSRSIERSWQLNGQKIIHYFCLNFLNLERLWRANSTEKKVTFTSKWRESIYDYADLQRGSLIDLRKMCNKSMKKIEK
jgi:hypothetical protein